MSESVSTVLWQRLDTAGHDACVLTRMPQGWRLSGMAVFLEDGLACQLRYRVDCDGKWRSRSASVAGWVGDRRIDLAVTSVEGGWALDGVEQPAVRGCVDIDLGFTPATNLIPMRRLELPVGRTVQAPAAWLTFPEPRLQRLEQTYQRVDDTRFEYRSPGPGYEGALRVDEEGWVAEYPGLWRKVR